MAITKQDIINTVGTSTTAERDKIVLTLLENQISIEPFMDILFLDHPVSNRFSWLLNDLSSYDASCAYNILLYIWKHRDKIGIKDINRVIAKQAFFISPELPEKIEGELVDALFRWLSEPQTTISTRNYALWAIDRLCVKYPDLRDEFHAILQEVKELYSDDFRKRVEKIIGK